MVKLFSDFKLGEVELKNRIVMSPMCMYLCEKEDGIATQEHIIHYGARAAGQVKMIIVKATAVTPRGRISLRDLGLWSDEQVPAMQQLVEAITGQGCVAAIQLNHAGRKAKVEEPGLAPSALAFNEEYPAPQEMTEQQIQGAVQEFRAAAQRAAKAGFQVIEIHGAHGYLVNQFLSPLTNQRSDGYGGSRVKRQRFLWEVLEAVRGVWSAPIILRISAEEYAAQGNHPQDYLELVRELKEWGVALLDCSSGAVVPAKIEPYPGYQVSYAEYFRQQTGIATGAVGLITSPLHAQEVVANERADLVLLGRELLRNPNWPIYAAKELQTEIMVPDQYRRGWL